ncbi:uroporphyrinogen-III C-methyltransferase [Mesobacillus maritimus]|uniref:uroporphyrinogen-III C-methyltransferase n=1 Tax=Mesobacillus maritimus TaxID=1643336 RepID=A0ABS7K7G4_9BACI|nr:uroporphyrinogen-III C-methyltransferase [Mesobacillus maritimus]MBY0098041.1 uroporphyrinogen-III C-methyltransferase [Mesobacillus maritimus]
MKRGKVYLVGAGPGDIGLITVKGMEAIKQADVILYDRLANPKLLEYAPAGCELIYCGKLPDRHVLRQEAINSLLVEKGLQGKVVVRLKGGDPGVFGRVGEEAAALVEHSIPYEMVPGITSGIAAPLYAGIPVTHREFGESFAIITAHDKSKEGQPNLNWASLATGIDTIAFYMGISNLPYISENLIKHGKSADTPVILVRWGTFSRQETLEGTLGDIAEKAKNVKFTNPAITLVGDIVSLRKRLNWFEQKPLFGRQILMARTDTNESPLAKELINQGADVIEFPRWTKTKAPAHTEILENISSYKKILFTSPESVTDFFRDLFDQRIDVRRITATFFGESTKSVYAIQEKGFLASLAAEMDNDLEHILVVGDNSKQKSYEQHDFYLTSYKQVDEQFLPLLARMLDEAQVNTIVFPSSGAVKVFMAEGVNKGLIGKELLEKAEIVCLGEKTKNSLREFSYQADLVPETPSKEAVITCLRK